MDTTASLIAIIDLSLKLVDYIKNVKDGGKERKDLRGEIITVCDVVEDMKSDFESLESDEAHGWSKSIKPLFISGGPIEQLKALLDDLTVKIEPPSQKALSIGQKLKWPFQKAEVQRLLGRLRGLTQAIHLTLDRANYKIGRDTNLGVQQVRSALDEFTLENSLQRISSLNFRRLQKADQKQPLPGTGQWFLDDPQVRGWSEYRTPILWCHGIPGAGKTVLASAMFQQLDDQYFTSNSLVLVAYCSFDDKSTHSAYNIICSFVRQLAEKHGNIPESVKQLYAQQGKVLRMSRPDLAQVVETLQTELAKFDRIFVILDGLDELPDHQQRAELLRTLESLNPLPQLMVTSRPVPLIDDWFYKDATKGRYQLQAEDLCDDQASYTCYNCDRDADTSDAATSENFDIKSLDSRTLGDEDWRYEASYRCGNESCRRDICVNCYDKYDICLGCSKPKASFQWAWPGYVTITAQTQDLQRYIAWRIDRKKPMECKSKPPPPPQGSFHALTFTRFLLAKFHMNSLEEQSNPRELLNGLKSLPSNITDIYASVIGRISNLRRASVLKNLILIVATARQPLSLDALKQAVSLDYGDKKLDDLKFPSVKHLVSMCAGLLEVDFSGVVRLTHETIGDYIAQTGLKDFGDGHITLAMICLTYLRFSAFASGACSGPEYEALLEKRQEDYPLLRYAATHWGMHFRKMQGKTTDAKASAIEFVHDKAHVAAASQFMWLDNLETSSGWDAENGVHGLHLCAYFGLNAIISELTKKETNIDVEDCHKTTPLMYAAQNGHTDTVHFLLHAGADPRRVCSRGTTALHRACRNGRTDIVKEFVQLPNDIGINALDEDRDNYSALMHAVYRNSTEIVKMLLSRPDINVELQRPERVWPPSAFLLAVAYGRRTMIKELLNDGRASKDSVGLDQKTALAIAARHGDEGIVTILLDSGANIESRDFYGGTPLLRAIDGNSLTCVQILLDRGANHTARDRFGRGILHSCAVNRRGLIMRFLLESIDGLNVDAQGDRGETPLHDAVRSDSERGVRILLEHGARTDIEDNSGQTPLRAAHDSNLSRMFELIRQARLKEENVNEALRESKLQSPRRRDTLLSEIGMTIHLAVRKLSRNELENYLDMLGQESSTYINKPDNHSNSPLHIAAARGLNENVCLLLERGADINGRDKWGFTPLLRAVDAPIGNQYLDVVNSLLQHPDCDIEAVENLDRSALNLATQRESREECACILLKRHVRFEARDGWLLRVLDYAVRTNQIDIVKILAVGGVPLHIRDISRMTPYQRARLAGHDELAQYLFEWNRSRKHTDSRAPREEATAKMEEPTTENISDESSSNTTGEEGKLGGPMEDRQDTKLGKNQYRKSFLELGKQFDFSRREQGFVSIILVLCVLLYWK